VYYPFHRPILNKKGDTLLPHMGLHLLNDVYSSTTMLTVPINRSIGRLIKALPNKPTKRQNSRPPARQRIYPDVVVGAVASPRPLDVHRLERGHDPEAEVHGDCPRVTHVVRVVTWVERRRHRTGRTKQISTKHWHVTTVRFMPSP